MFGDSFPWSKDAITFQLLFPLTSLLPWELWCPVDGWHVWLELTESTKEELSVRGGSGTGKQPNHWIACREPSMNLPWKSQKEVSHLLPISQGIRFMSLWVCVCARTFPCAKCLLVPVSQQSSSLFCTSGAKRLPRIISQLGNGKLLDWLFHLMVYNT